MTRRTNAYMIRDDVEFLHDGQHEQQRPTAAEVQQHAKPAALNTMPISIDLIRFDTKKSIGF